MKRAIIYFVSGTLLSFILYYLFVDTQNLALNLYYSLAYGSAWGLAYYLDNPKFSLPLKLGISLLAMVVLVVVGFFIFDLKLAVPSVIKFSIIFVAYYLMASFRSSKSLRE
ncbi:hypothetical protein [Halpernia frigidisoli]|uniref:Uncharacterized protein n=1 Tax=Halpernia frigidisoli TaxID=1125876 RepID=A0A1I3HWZ3_9FLAO|nr:hypothetical protein [Halpernia frigidisoli]SFI40090.1 hypothetical protein SAMN05443292_2430 [Halpernia frigidisoli]